MKILNRKDCVALCLAAVAIVVGPLSSHSLWAQKPKTDPAKNKGDKSSKNDPNQSAVSMEIAKAEGKWDAFQQGVIKILNAENQEVFLQSENDTVVRYTAQADPAWLMPGYMVRFSAEFDQSGKPTAPLKAIEVFTPVRGRMSPEIMREQTPGIHMEVKADDAKGGNDLANNNNNANNNKKPPANTKRPSNKKDTTPVPGQSFRVVGTVGGMQNNVLTVIASKPIQIEMDPAAVVNVTANDIASAFPMIVKGDLVSVSGLRSPATPSMILCEQITIKAANKLTQAMPTGKRGKTTGRDKDSDSKNSKDKDKDKDKSDAKKTNADKKPAPNQ